MKETVLNEAWFTRYRIQLFMPDRFPESGTKNAPQDECLHYSLSPGFWQSFISIEVCRDCIPALASSCKKQLTGFFVCLLFFLKVKRIS